MYQMLVLVIYFPPSTIRYYAVVVGEEASFFRVVQKRGEGRIAQFAMADFKGQLITCEIIRRCCAQNLGGGRIAQFVIADFKGQLKNCEEIDKACFFCGAKAWRMKNRTTPNG
eukprot:gene7386-8206_t